MPKHPDYLSIGKVAKLKNVSIKSLRYYDRIGILTPAYVDKVSKYRYYTREQLYLLDAIRLCLALGIPLRDLNRYVQEDHTVNLQNLLYDGKEMAEKRLREIQEALSTLQDTLAELSKVADTTAVNVQPITPATNAAKAPSESHPKEASVKQDEHSSSEPSAVSKAETGSLPIYPRRHLLAVPMESDISPKYFGQYILKLFVSAQQAGLSVGYPSAVIYQKTHAGVKRFMAMQIRVPEGGGTPFISDNAEGITVFTFPEGPLYLSENAERIPFSDPALLSRTPRAEAEGYFAKGDILVEEDCMDPQLKEAGVGFLLMTPVL
ncbi:MAG: helix-turn-helix domain-containing protein [Lachnospiraceae bacterium]|nr:helix-turn-helix domain-containing protein [Lachnospiraceae bacterium]